MLYEGKRLQKGKVPRKRGMPKKSGRRLLSGLLALVLCLTLVPVIYADTVVSVESWHDAEDFEEKTLYWVDNNDEESRRPAAEDYQPLLYFRIEGEDWRALEEDTCSDVGLSSVPQMTVVDNGNNTYTVSVPDHRLPKTIIREDDFGAESEPLAVEWALGPAGSGGEEETDYFGSYIPVDVNQDNVEDYPSAGGRLGWYYVLTDEFSFDVQLRQGDRTAADGITDALYQTFLFSVDTGYDATTATYLLDTIREVLDVNSDVGTDTGDPSGTITISGLWKYNLDGSRIEYSVEEAPNGDGRLDADDGILDSVLDAGDWFQISYDNSGAPNVGSEVDKVYDGGILYLTLTGTKDYSATKVWEDQVDSSHRPDGELQLWRYRAGQSYTTAAPVRDNSGSVMTISLDKQDTQEIAFGDLPKYDAEGYEYIYVVREYLTGDDAGRYTQVLGAVDANGDVSDTIWVLGSNGRLQQLTGEEADGKRGDNDTYLYNGGTLSNKLSGTVTVDATKIWKAAAFQSELTDVQVELTLQSRPKGSTDDDAWENTDITKTLGGGGENGSFSAENLGGLSVSESVPKYDNQGRELEYRWVESAVYEGESENILEGDSFTLTSGGSRGEARYQVTYQQNDNGTVITNAVSNRIDYTVQKKWEPDDQSNPKHEVTFALYRTIGEQSLTEGCKVLTFAMDEEGAFVKDSIEPGDAYIDEIDNEITISGENWDAFLNSLPEYDEEGRRYEYLILEEGGSPTYETTIDSETGDYTTIVTNGPGTGKRILVQKNWVDDSDTAHREPVEVTVYDRNSGDPIKNGDENLTVTLGETQDGEDPVWYEWVALPENIKAADVYIRETGIGTVGKVELSQDADGSFRDKVTGENHTYEATYDSENVANEIVWTVTNRRLGNVDLTVTKDWRDGNGEGVDALQAAMAGTGLTLAVKLEISASDGTYIIGKDYVNLGGEDVPIKDNKDQPVSSVQPILTADEEYHEIYFHNLPKYDTNGTVVRYTVEEVWLDQTGKEITLSAANYPEVYALWSTYTRSVEETSYDANDGALENDTQEITLTNTRTGVTDAVWYKQWNDVYMYEAGSRPDIYLDIYQTVHTSETETETETVTQLIYPSYRWTDEGLLPPETEEPDTGGDAGGSEGEVSETPAEASGDTAQQYVWQALLEDLPKYDAYGFEIVYSAVERTNVNASEFDYAIAEYWWEGTRLGTRNEADTESEDAYTAHTTALTGRQTEDYAKYALNAGGTFVNRLDKPLTIEGRKLWTNLPAGYPAEDLPTVTFALYQRERGGAYDFDADPIATLTISDWSGLNNYTFQILYVGENIIDSSGEVQPVTPDQKSLPKYTPEGRLYEYTLRETGITGTDGASLVDDESTDTDIPLFEMRQPSNTFQAENVYNSSTGSLSVKKILELPTDEEGDPIAYPAVRFHLYRTYTKNSGETSEQELVQTITWSSQEVQEAYQEQGQATVEKTLTFEGLAQYAPNGSEYVYQIEEDQDFLGGYETKCGRGDLDADGEALQNGAAVEDLLPDEDRNADATFWNRREAPQTEFVTLTGTKVWQDFDNAFGLRPDGPYVQIENGDWIPVIRLSVTRSAAAQEGQEAPNITETLEEGTDYTVTWTQEDDVTWTYQIWGIGDQDIEDPQYPAEPGEPETPTDTQTDLTPTDPDVSEPPSTGENDQSETPTAAEGNDQTAGSEEKTTQPPESSLSAASLHSDPADAGGSGSEADTTPGDGSDITPDPTEDPETDPGEDSPAPAQTELEKWAPNGARWVYSVKEELNPALPDELKEQYKIYFNNQTAGQSSTDGDTITMSNLTNSLETSARFEKKWVGSDGQSITADYMGLGEMSVTFTLYVKAGEDGIWQPAEEYFENMDSGLYSQIFGEDYQFTQTLGNRHIYDSWTGTFQHLPRVVKVNDKIVELSYRVAETKLTYHNGRETVDVPITVTVEGDTFTYTVNDSLFTGVTGDYATSTSELTNQLATTSLKVQKVWANDRNNAYDTRPDTDEEGMTWETSFLIQRTTAATPAEEDWQAVQVTGDGNETQDLVVTLTGTNSDSEKEYTLSGLPQKASSDQIYTYRAVELLPEYKTAGEEASLHDYIVENEGQYNTAYTATYAYDDGSTGGDPDNGSAEEGFITKVTNTMSTTKVYASKSWEPAEETGVPVTLKLQYMTAPAADGAEATWQEMASVKVTVDGTKDAFSPSKPYYEYEAWKAVWEDLPARMPGSYLGENGTTQYRVVEETSGSYVLVNSDTGEVPSEDGKTTYPEFQFTNKAITSLTVLKQWHTTADKIADSITVQLWRTTDKNLVGQTEGDVVQVAGKTATLSAANNWKVVFGELDRVDTHGDRYYYYAVETSTGESLEVSYDHSDLDGTAFTTTITNKGFTDITVTKTWQDDNDAQDLRPDTLKLTLYRKTAVTEQKKVEEVTLSAEHAQSGNSNVWTYTFQDLPDTDENGNLYTYWVEEEPVSGYTESRTDDLDLVNTLGDEDTEVQIQGEKTWVGDDPAKRPASITVILLQNGTEVKRQEVRPNEDGKWTYDFGNWPVYDDSGRAYTYTVQEEPVDGYGTQVNGYDIVNGQGGLTVTKQVYSGDKTREFRFTVTLSDKTVNGTYGDMTFIDGVAEFTLKDGESKTAAGLLPGIRYTVTEERVSGYGIRVEGSNPGTIPFGDTAEVLVINYDDTTPPPDPKPDPDPDPDPDPTPDPDPDPDPTPDPDETPDPDIPDTPDEPGTPDEPDTPEEPDDSVHTGDDAQLALYLTLLAASLAGAAAVIFLGRRGRKKE